MNDLSALGLGSGVLSYDLIDQLKNVDKQHMVDPITNKIEENTNKQTSLTELITELKNLKNYSDKLSDISTFSSRSAITSNDNISVNAGNGLIEQNIKIDVQQLAQNDILEFNEKFSSREDIFSINSQTFNLSIDDKNYEISINSNSTLEEVANIITDQTDGVIRGTVLNVGGTNGYRLMLNSENTGERNQILFGSTINTNQIESGNLNGQSFDLTFKDNNDNNVTLSININNSFDEATNEENANIIKEEIINQINNNIYLKDLLVDNENINGNINISVGNNNNNIIINDNRGKDITINNSNVSNINEETQNGNSYNFERISLGQDSIFTYNGIEMSREQNYIDDIVSGLSLTLKDEGQTNIQITNNTENIKENIQNFINQYNSLLDTIDTLTNYDSDIQTSSVFTNVREITSIMRDLRSSLYQTNSDNENILSYGINIEENGKLTLNENMLDNNLENNFDKLKELFYGYEGTMNNGKDTFQIEGVFTKSSDILNNLTNFVNGSLTNYENNLENNFIKLNEEKEEMLERLEIKYNQMAERFSLYDTLIAKLNNNASILDSLINQESKE